MDHPAAWAEMPSHPACCRDWEGLLTNCYGLIPSMICLDRKSTRLNSSHDQISYAVFCLKKKKKKLYSPLETSFDAVEYAVVEEEGVSAMPIGRSVGDYGDVVLESGLAPVTAGDIRESYITYSVAER